MNLITAKDAYDKAFKISQDRFYQFKEKRDNMRKSMLSDAKINEYLKIINDLIISQVNIGHKCVDIPLSSDIDLKIYDFGLNPNLQHVLYKLEENGFEIDRFVKKIDNNRFYKISIYWYKHSEN